METMNVTIMNRERREGEGRCLSQSLRSEVRGDQSFKAQSEQLQLRTLKLRARNCKSSALAAETIGPQMKQRRMARG